MRSQLLLDGLMLLALLAPPAAGLALLLRGAGRGPGGAVIAALLGGGIAGLVLGQSVLGRVAPELHERMLIGGAEQRLALEDVAGEHEREIAALRAVGVTGAAVDELRDRHAEAIRPLERAWIDARNGRTAALYTLASLCFVGTLLCAGARCVRPGRASMSESWRGSVGAGVCGVGVAGAAGGVLGMWLLDLDAMQALALAGAIGVGGFAFGSRAALQGFARRSESVMRAGFVATLIGVALITIAAPSRTTGVMLAAVFAGWGITSQLPYAPRRVRRWLNALALGVAAPTLAACVATRFDVISLLGQREFWFAALIVLIFCSDGRWLGGWLGWWTLGSRRAGDEAWRRSSAMIDSESSLNQVGMAALLGLIGLLSQAILAALFLGALLIELTSGVRRMIAPRLDRGEPFVPAEEDAEER